MLASSLPVDSFANALASSMRDLASSANESVEGVTGFAETSVLSFVATAGDPAVADEVEDELLCEIGAVDGANP